MQTRPHLIIFDVNETLLDLAPLKSKVNVAMGNDLAFDLWFRTLLHYSLVETVTERYSDFSSIAEAVFTMVAKKFDKDIPDAEVQSVLETIKHLPPHSDVIPAMTRLKKEGFTMVALTNGNQEVALAQLAYAKIDHFFDKILSVENVKKYKPHAIPYTSVLKKMDTPANKALLIAAHGWDIVGAQRVGMKTAFVGRQGKSLYSLGDAPDLTGRTVLEISQMLTAI